MRLKNSPFAKWHRFDFVVFFLLFEVCCKRSGQDAKKFFSLFFAKILSEDIRTDDEKMSNWRVTQPWLWLSITSETRSKMFAEVLFNIVSLQSIASHLYSLSNAVYNESITMGFLCLPCLLPKFKFFASFMPILLFQEFLYINGIDITLQLKSFI